MKKLRTGTKAALALCLVLLLAAGVLGWRIAVLGRLFPGMEEARRWQGESETPFTQLSVFVPADETLTQSQVVSFRYAMLSAFQAASLEGRENLFEDAWSSRDALTVSSDRSTAEMTVTAVGGAYFSFHPLTRLSGTYLTEGDIGKTRILLNREAAWRLFGGTELAGLTVTVQDQLFEVAGVVDREDDRFTDKVCDRDMEVYLPYEAWVALTGEDRVDCYEVVMPQPVEDFAQGVAEKDFPVASAVTVTATDRFLLKNLLALRRERSERLVQSSAVAYPYWENARRIAEDRGSAMALWLVLCLCPVALGVLALLVLALRRGKRRMEEKLPRLRDALAEKIRVRQRRRWERKNGKG